MRELLAVIQTLTFQRERAFGRQDYVAYESLCDLVDEAEAAAFAAGATREAVDAASDRGFDRALGIAS